jgi:hypothetical protein
MLDRLGVIGTFGFYSSLNIAALVLIFLFVPETKQRTLEELDYIFAVPSRVFMRYQITKTLPWWFKRWILFRKNATLAPLYTLDVAEHQEEDDEEDNNSSDIGFENDKARVEMKDIAGYTTTTYAMTESINRFNSR